MWTKRLLTTGLMLWLLIAAFQQASLVSFLYPTVSLRFDDPLDAVHVQRTREYAQKNGGPWLTFWSERKIRVNGFAAQQITFDGESMLAYPAEYRYGHSATTWESETCAVSTGLAWRVWGGENAVGLELTVEDVTCRIVGVFPAEEAVLIRPDTGNFTAVELENVPPGEDSYRYTSNYAYVCGLGTPDKILWGSGFADWIQILPWIPLVLSALPLADLGARKCRKLSSFWRSALAFGLAFGAAFALPGLLERLPPWLLPTWWSDFDFWIRLGETLKDRCRDVFALNPQSRDVQAKIAVVKVIFATLGACILVKSEQK